MDAVKNALERVVVRSETRVKSKNQAPHGNCLHDASKDSSNFETKRVGRASTSMLQDLRSAEGLKEPTSLRDIPKNYDFQFSSSTDPVNDDPGLMIEIYLKGKGQLAEVYCERGEIKADIFAPKERSEESSEWPEIQRELAHAVESGKMTLQGWIEQDMEEGRK